MTNSFKYEPKLNSVSPRSNLPRRKHGAYVINLDDINSKGTNWISLFIDRNLAFIIYCQQFSFILLKKIRDKSIIHNIFTMQDKESVVC